MVPKDSLVIGLPAALAMKVVSPTGPASIAAARASDTGSATLSPVFSVASRITRSRTCGRPTRTASPRRRPVSPENLEGDALPGPEQPSGRGRPQRPRRSKTRKPPVDGAMTLTPSVGFDVTSPASSAQAKKPAQRLNEHVGRRRRCCALVPAGGDVPALPVFELRAGRACRRRRPLRTLALHGAA